MVRTSIAGYGFFHADSPRSCPLRRRVGWVTVVVLVVLGALVGGGLAYLSSRQQADLPSAAEQVRLATTDVAEIFSGLEGAQDDLLISEALSEMAVGQTG